MSAVARNFRSVASYLHETLVAMFRHRPALAAELLSQQLGLAVPAHDEVRLGSAEVIELRPAAHRADAVVLAEDHTGPVFAVIVEVQLRPDEDKTWVWPEYLTAVRRDLRCPVALLVVCVDAATARWAAEPIDLGDGVSRIGPMVLGPAAIPVLDDPVAASTAPELAVLSALAHVREDGPFNVLDALSVALNHTPVEQAVEYVRLVLAELPEMARRHLEELMAAETFHYESEWTRSLEARGKASTLLKVLEVRGIEVDEESRFRIANCTDLAQLDAWVERAITGHTVADLFV